jgi:hypothetical protein
MKKNALATVSEEMVEKYETRFSEEIFKIMQQYKEKFSSFGLELNCRMFWENIMDHEISDTRIPLHKGYRSYIVIEMLKNNKKVLLNDEENGQVFVLSSIVFVEKQMFSKCYVVFSDETDDIIEDLEECYQLVKEYGAIEWEKR